MVDLIQKDSWSSDTSKIMFDFWKKFLVERHLTHFVRATPNEILVFLMNFIFFPRKEITLWGKKLTALSQTHEWEKSSFLNTFVRVFARIYANTCQMCPPPGVNIVDIDKIWHKSVAWLRSILTFSFHQKY